MARNCCAHGCAATSENAPFRNFHTLTQVRGSLTEWLLAFNRLDILADFTIRRKPDSFSICDMHFPSLQKDNAPTNTHATEDRKRFTSNKETQTQTIAPKLMVTPVEIVDIQPDPLMISLAVDNVPRIEPINIPATLPGQTNLNTVNIGAISGYVTNVNPAKQQIRNNNIQGFIGTINQPMATVQVTGPMTSEKSARPRILRRIQPKVNNPIIPGYIVNLNSLQSTPPIINIVDMATNYMQAHGGNVNLAATNTSARLSMDSDEVETIHDISQDEDPIKIEDDDDKTHLSTDCDDKYGESNIDTEPDEFGNDIVRIQFPTNGAETQEDDDDAYVKFEVEETSSDKIETYCFFDDDNEATAKRRKVESTDSGFQIVKLELEPDRTII